MPMRQHFTEDDGKMSEKRGFVCRGCRWKLFLAAIVGGFVGAGADDLVGLLLAARADPWVAECDAMLEDEKDSRRGWSYTIRGSVCVAVVYPELPDRDLIHVDAPNLRDRTDRTVLDTHEAALRAAGDGGEVRVRLQVDPEGTPFDVEIAESSGNPAVEAFALDLATTMSFSPAPNGDAATESWAEYSVAVGVRAPQ